MKRCHRSRAGLTLIELMVSITLGMALIAASWTAFQMTRTTAQRTTIRIDLHTSAAILRESFQRDFVFSSPATACFVRSTPGVMVGTDRVDTIDLLFMRSVHPLRPQMTESIDGEFMADHHWVRWRFRRVWHQVDGAWHVREQALLRSRSSPTRRWNVKGAIYGATQVYDAATDSLQPPNATAPLSYINMARPIRDASHGIAALDFNRYNVPNTPTYIDSTVALDIGDLTDLDQNEVVVSTRVLDVTFGWVDAGGHAHLVTSGTAADHRIHGLYMDVVGPVGNTHRNQIAARPRIMRVGMTLAQGHVTQDFSFSFATPGLTPIFRP